MCQCLVGWILYYPKALILCPWCQASKITQLSYPLIDLSLEDFSTNTNQRHGECEIKFSTMLLHFR